MRSIVALSLVLGILGCDEASRPPPQKQYPDADPQQVQQETFWGLVRAYGDWVEHQPTLVELADSADAVLVARLLSVEPGHEVQGSGGEDYYAEMLVHAEVTEALRDSTDASEVTFSFSLFGADSPGRREDMLEAARSALPIDDVLLLLRQRSDKDYYRVVNGYGIWASTARHELDAPMQLQPPLTWEEPFPYKRELAPIETLDQLIDLLR